MHECVELENIQVSGALLNVSTRERTDRVNEVLALSIVSSVHDIKVVKGQAVRQELLQLLARCKQMIGLELGELTLNIQF